MSAVNATQAPPILHLSSVVGSPLRDSAGERLGKVEDGTTVSDFEPDEREHKISIGASVIPIEWRDCKINLLDTPGYQDFIGELRGRELFQPAPFILQFIRRIEQQTPERGREQRAGGDDERRCRRCMRAPIASSEKRSSRRPRRAIISCSFTRSPSGSLRRPT